MSNIRYVWVLYLGLNDRLPEFDDDTLIVVVSDDDERRGLSGLFQDEFPFIDCDLCDETLGW